MIEIKLTCETVAEAQHEMAALLRGTNITSGWEPKAIAPVAPTPPAASTTPSSTPNSDLAEHPLAAPAEVSGASTPSGASSASTESGEQPKRGRGRPRKDAAAADTPLTSGVASADAGNASTPEPGATATAEPTSGAASSTSSETVAAQEAPGEPAPSAEGQQPTASSAEATTASPGATTPTASPSDDIQPVTDVDLQRFSAKVAEKLGGPQPIFDACKPFLPEGTVARPTNIMRTEDRWAFIRQMEIATGLTFHG